MSKIYAGRRFSPGEVVVEVHETHPENETTTRDLPPRNDIRNHSPDGFEWGYAGSGPAQLALAILADFTGRAPSAREYQKFKGQIIQNLREDRWEITGAQVEDFYRRFAEGDKWS